MFDVTEFWAEGRLVSLTIDRGHEDAAEMLGIAEERVHGAGWTDVRMGDDWARIMHRA